MKKDILNSLIKKYLSGKISEEEKEILDQEWNNSLINNQSFNNLNKRRKEKLEIEIFTNIKSRTSGKKEGVEFPDPKKKKTEFNEEKNSTFFSKSLVLKVAAIFIGILFISVLAYNFLNDNNFNIYSTTYGETLTILLSDSSIVTLNSNSSIKFKDKWKASQNREIWMEGEAFFLVKHRNKQEFIVHASGLEVKALGTAFNVNNRRTNAWVVLNSGSVLLNQQGSLEDIVLQPGEMAEFSAFENEFKTRLVNPEVYTSWRNKKLVFEKTSIRKIAEILEDNYGVEVIINDPELAEMTFSATIPMEDLDILLDLLSETFNINVQRQHKKVIFNTN